MKINSLKKSFVTLICFIGLSGCSSYLERKEIELQQQFIGKHADELVKYIGDMPQERQTMGNLLSKKDGTPVYVFMWHLQHQGEDQRKDNCWDEVIGTQPIANAGGGYTHQPIFQTYCDAPTYTRAISNYDLTVETDFQYIIKHLEIGNIQTHTVNVSNEYTNSNSYLPSLYTNSTPCPTKEEKIWDYARYKRGEITLQQLQAKYAPYRQCRY